MSRRRQTLLSVSLSTVVMTGGLLASQFAFAQSEGYDCVSESPEDVLCLSLPAGQEASEARPARSARTAPVAQKKVSMLSENELSGSANSIENQFNLESSLAEGMVAEKRSRVSTSATRQSLVAQDKLKQIEIFTDLSERSSGSGRGTVTAAGRK